MLRVAAWDAASSTQCCPHAPASRPTPPHQTGRTRRASLIAAACSPDSVVGIYAVGGAQHWGADRMTDLKHWSKFECFAPIKDAVFSGKVRAKAGKSMLPSWLGRLCKCGDCITLLGPTASTVVAQWCLLSAPPHPRLLSPSSSLAERERGPDVRAGRRSWSWTAFLTCSCGGRRSAS